jgi:ribosomal protein S17E
MIFAFLRGSIAGYVTKKKGEKGSKEPKRMVNKTKIP